MALSRLTRLGGLSLLSAWMSAGGSARADPPGKASPPIHVVAVQSEGSYDQAEALTAAIRSRVRALRGYSLGDGDFALEVLTLGLKCAEIPDEECQAKIASQIHADRFVWGSVEHARPNRQVNAELHLWVRGQPPASIRLTYSDNLTAPGDESLRRLVDEALQKLTATAQPSSGESPVVAVSSKSRVGAGGPGGARGIASPSSGEETDGSRRVLGWTGIGLGSFFVAAGLYSLVRVHDIATSDRYEIYSSDFPSGMSPCDRARAGLASRTQGAATLTEMRDFCSQLSTFETLEVVFFGAALLSAGTGIYLLATDPSNRAVAAAPRFRLAASAEPRAGRVQLRVDF
jgi:hypothetical protein